MKSRRMRWAGHVACMKMITNAFKMFVGRPEGKRSLRRPGCKWEDNIKRDLRKIVLEDVDWIHLTQNRDQWQAPVKMVMNLQVP
jgi:hypothetical protein